MITKEEIIKMNDDELIQTLKSIEKCKSLEEDILKAIVEILRESPKSIEYLTLPSDEALPEHKDFLTSLNINTENLSPRAIGEIYLYIKYHPAMVDFLTDNASSRKNDIQAFINYFPEKVQEEGYGHYPKFINKPWEKYEYYWNLKHGIPNTIPRPSDRGGLKVKKHHRKPKGKFKGWK